MLPIFNPERIRLDRNPFRVSIFFCVDPKVVAALQPWAEISERLRRIFKVNQSAKSKGGLKWVKSQKRSPINSFT